MEKNEGGSSIDMKTLIHVGVEVLVVGTITFWFQRKAASQQAEIEELRDRIGKFEETIEAQGKMLAEHRNIFQSILGHGRGAPQPQLPPQQMPTTRQPPQYLPAAQHAQPANNQQAPTGIGSQKPPAKKPSPPVRQPSPEPSEEEEEEHDNEEEEEEESEPVDMDELLKEELQSITRKSSPPPKGLKASRAPNTASKKKKS